MTKYLHITEYSSLVPYKIPQKKPNEHDLVLDTSIIRSSFDDNKCPIRESLDTVFDESKLVEKTIPLDDVIIYDNIDMANEDQKLAYVFECPICLEKTITTDPTFGFCPRCENNTFPPEVIALINVSQMEELAVDNPFLSTLIQVKGNKIIFKEEPKSIKKEKEKREQQI